MTTARALLFARLRELAGQSSSEVAVPAGTDVAAVWSALRAQHPALPDLATARAGVRAAVNRNFAPWDAPVAAGDEVAFIPPVSGGMAAAVHVEVTAGPLDPRRLEAAVADPGAGGICTFTGVVRDNARGERVTHLEYEAYAAMAELQMEAIAAEVAERWPEARLAMAHRTGRLEVGEASVAVCASAPHRAEAFAACRHAIDRLKESVPVWKKEFAESGASWIEGPTAVPASPESSPG